jgi:hypothetical protein
MVTTRLQIGNNLNVAQVADIPVIKTFLESDIRQPDKRNTSFAKAVQLYGSSDVNILFENIFEANIATQYFNANIKTPIFYYENEVETFRGYLQLLRITLTPDGNVVYDCNIVGETGNFWIDLKDDLLTDLDYSDLDHDYTRTNIIASWTNNVSNYGEGYYYGLVNRGTILGDESVWRVRDFLPSLYDYEYLVRIFADKGYTWDSDFLESEFFKRHITYPNIESLVLSQTELDNRQFNVGRLTNFTLFNEASASPGTSALVTIPFNRETAPFFDAGNNYSGTNYVVPKTGTYNFSTKLRLKFTITHTNVLAVKSDNIVANSGASNTLIYKNNNIAAQLSRTTFGIFNEATGLAFAQDNFKTNFENGTPFYTNLEISTGDLFATASDVLNARQIFNFQLTRDGVNPVRFYQADGTTLITTGSINVLCEVVADVNRTMFYGLVTNKDVIEGDEIEMINAVPRNIKQRDFVKSVMQKYNLVIQPDKFNPSLLIIEPYNDYYGVEIDESWMNKLDKSKDVVVNPMSELDAKTYIYKYKSDKDYYNRIFEENYKEPFGTHEQELENDFIKSTNVNELIWSPTPNVANYTLGIAYPKIYDLDGSTVKRITPNIRNLYAKVKTSNVGITFKEEGGSDLIITQYGYCGHTDDPFNPTIDTNFGIPKQVFYSFVNSEFTDNNIFNGFHKKFIDQISNRDSKLIYAYLWLTEIDIEGFSFRKNYPILGKDKMVTYYRVNKILNYTNSEGSTMCELLKLAEVELFTPTEYEILDLPNYSTERVISTPLVTPSKNVNVYSDGIVSVEASEDVLVMQGAKYISVVGSTGIVIGEDVENVSVVNCSKLTITQSNVSYFNNILVPTFAPQFAPIKTTTINTALKITENTVLVDATSGNRNVNLPNPATGVVTGADGIVTSKMFTIKKIDSSAYTVTITATIGQIEFSPNIVLTTQGESVTVQTDGTDWFII